MPERISKRRSTKPVEMTLETGEVILVEAVVLDPDVDVSQLPTLRLEEFTRMIGGVARSIRSGLVHIGATKASAEFGLELGLETGKLTSLLAKGSGKANLKITIEWDDLAGTPTNHTGVPAEGTAPGTRSDTA